jgi:hypothetical protein
MREPLTLLDQEPVSMHAAFVCYPRGQYRHENPKQRRAALRAALHGVPLSAYDQYILHWLAGWDVPTVATVVSLLRRTHHTAAGQDCRGGGEPR